MAQSTQQSELAALSDRIADVQGRIDDAARRAGRSASDVTLVGVCKTVDRQAVDLAYEAGLRHFGENRVQDAVKKFEVPAPDDFKLHMIGALQTNKANQVIGRFCLVHSLDRPALADALSKRAVRNDVVQPVLVQVNVAREEQKHGCLVEDLPALIEHIAGLEGLDLQGFMTMAPLVSTPDEARPVFADMKRIADSMTARYPDVAGSDISMGMTNDFEVAIEEGATIVRVGRAIFQERATS